MRNWLKKHAGKLMTGLLLSGAVSAMNPPATEAHLATLGYSDINIQNDTIQYGLYLDPREIAQWSDIRYEGVYVIGGAESEAPSAGEQPGWSEEELAQLVSENLEVKSGGEAAVPAISDISMKEKAGAPYVYMNLKYSFPAPVESYSIDYRFFFDDLDPQHQNFATISAGENGIDTVFNADNRVSSDLVSALANGRATTSLQIPGWLAAMGDYILLGMEHIWTGYDHLLFVAALVLLKQSMKNYLKIVTAFTLGHSVTIALAALDVFSLPAAIVEPLIALSIVYVAVENIWLKRLEWRWAVALAFGLMHGFGFAQVLQGALGERYLLSLFSFNLGVEIGQIAVLAVLLPLLLLAGRMKWYRSAAFAVSGLIALTGTYWFVERVFL